MDIKVMVAIVAVMMTLVGYSYYFKDIFAGKTKPHAFSWLVWASLTAIAFAGQISDNAGAGAWITLVTAAISFVIFFLALKVGEKTITIPDWISLGGRGWHFCYGFLPAIHYQQSFSSRLLISLDSCLQFANRLLNLMKKH